MTGLCHAFHRSYVGSAVLHSPTVVLTEDKASVIRSVMIVMILSNNKDCDDDDDEDDDDDDDDDDDEDDDDDDDDDDHDDWFHCCDPCLSCATFGLALKDPMAPTRTCGTFQVDRAQKRQDNFRKKTAQHPRTSPPKLHLLLIFIHFPMFSHVFRRCPIFINLHGFVWKCWVNLPNDS